MFNSNQSPSPLPPPTALETDHFIGFEHPNAAVSADGNYGDPSDKLFFIYLAQADKFDKEQSESWNGDTEGILVFVRPTVLASVAKLGLNYLRQVSSLLP